MQNAGHSGSAEPETGTPKPTRPLIIAVAHQKGGVGKTTTTCNLAVGLSALIGRGTVAVVDLDPQGSATQHLGGDPAIRRGGTYELLTGRRSLGNLLRPTNARGTLMVQAEQRMTLAEVDPALRDLSHVRLRQLLCEDTGDVACILLDCPPGFGVFTTVGVLAADLVLVPMPPLPFSRSALDNAVQFIGGLRADGRQRIALLLTMVHAEDALQMECVEQLRATWHDQVFTATIPYDPVAEQAITAGRPALLHQPSAPIARAYQEAAEELYAGIAPVLPVAPDEAPPAERAPSPPPAPPPATSSGPAPDAPPVDDGQSYVSAIDPQPPRPRSRRAPLWPRLLMIFIIAMMAGAALIMLMASETAALLPAPLDGWAATGKAAIAKVIATLSANF